MADQLVAATVGALLEKTISIAADRIGLALGIGFYKDLKGMHEHAKDIQAVLADAGNKQSRNPIVLRWLNKVEAAAIEAGYVLDELLYESLRRKVESRDKAKVCLFFSLSKRDFSFRWRMGSRVREMNETFKKFISEVPGIGLARMEDSMSHVDAMAVAEAVTSRQTNSLPQHFVAGRAKEVSEIVGMLSFDYLPSLSIKKCFAHFSVYSKDTKRDGRELVEIWMAEGLLQEGVEGSTMMKEIGDNFLLILVQSSLLEKDKLNKFTGEGEYQMHDLVHDLAESVSKQEQISGERKQIDGEVRHLALSKYSLGYNARSTLVREMKGDISDEVLLRFKRLHVLDLFAISKWNVLDVIGNLKHLRCLIISIFEINILPESLCKLYNLQTLNLGGCYSLTCLPRCLSNLISLRHLHFRSGTWKMPPNMGRMTCLQTLAYYNVGEENDRGIKELGSMKNLKGMIKIRNLEFVSGKREARLASLFEKQKLVGLELCWSPNIIINCNYDHVAEGLEPNSKLQKLWLRYYMGVRLPQWIEKLTGLTKLRFINCKSFKDVPALGQLPYLKVLEIDGSEHVTCLGNSFYFEGLRGGKVFPSLTRMTLRNLPNLSEWKDLEAVNGGGVFFKLEELHIGNCCQLVTVPTSFLSLQTLTMEGNMRVSVVGNIIGQSAGLLKTLQIRSMGGLISFSDVIDNNLTCLEDLQIIDCDDLIDIPSSTLECCAYLNMLYVERCPNLMSCALNLQTTPSLSILWFSECSKVFTTNSMPRGFNYLTSLMDLSIGPFTDESLQLFDWSGLIQGCSSTVQILLWSGSFQNNSCLPQQLQHLTSLQQLRLTELKSVEELPDWLGSFTSLHRLELRGCPKLQYLPSAHSMRRLKSLRILIVYDCPLIPKSSNEDISSLPRLEVFRK